MLRLIYTSVQVQGFDQHDFALLCKQASANNQKLNIEGMLLFNGSEFMQCLEGPNDAVAEIYRKITQDTRHTDIRLLVSETTDTPLFENWSMVGLVAKPQIQLGAEPVAYTLLDHRLYRPWRALGNGAADLIYEYARVKAELDRTGETSLLGKVFDTYSMSGQ